VTRLLRPALFLDRDGVDGARQAVAGFNARGWWVFVVTNQSGVGRGYYSEDDVHALHARMAEDLAAAGARIDAFYHCPFHPEALEDRYRHPDPPDRKPNPGMLLKAMADWPVDAARSVMVGDKAIDLEAGRRAGVRSLHFSGGDLAAFLAAEVAGD